MTQRITGSCHCGAVQLSLAGAPLVVTECHCSICRRYAPLWAYYPECGVNARIVDGFDLSAVTLIIEEDSSV